MEHRTLELDRSCAEDVWEVNPSPAFCVKFKSAKTGKIFLNIAVCDELPSPKVINEDELAAIIESDDPGSYRIPLSASDPHTELDKSGETCSAVDVIINRQFYENQVKQSELFQTFLVLVACEAVQNKPTGMHLDRDHWTILKNRKSVGQLQSQNIRKPPLRPLIEEVRTERSAEVLKLLERLIPNRVSTSEATRQQHSHDESHHTDRLPDIVVLPRTVEEVAAAVRVCNENRVPVVPFGTGTGLESGVSATEGGVCVSLTGMDQVLDVKVEDFCCTVQPGVTRQSLNNYIHDTGLWFPVDPGAEASLCGMCATSASGTNAVRYGTMKDSVMNLEVVLPSGEVINTRGKGRRAR